MDLREDSRIAAEVRTNFQEGSTPKVRKEMAHSKEYSKKDRHKSLKSTHFHLSYIPNKIKEEIPQSTDDSKNVTETLDQTKVRKGMELFKNYSEKGAGKITHIHMDIRKNTKKEMAQSKDKSEKVAQTLEDHQMHTSMKVRKEMEPLKNEERRNVHIHMYIPKNTKKEMAQSKDESEKAAQTLEDHQMHTSMKVRKEMEPKKIEERRNVHMITNIHMHIPKKTKTEMAQSKEDSGKASKEVSRGCSKRQHECRTSSEWHIMTLGLGDKKNKDAVKLPDYEERHKEPEDYENGQNNTLQKPMPGESTPSNSQEIFHNILKQTKIMAEPSRSYNRDSKLQEVRRVSKMKTTDIKKKLNTISANDDRRGELNEKGTDENGETNERRNRVRPLKVTRWDIKDGVPCNTKRHLIPCTRKKRNHIHTPLRTPLVIVSPSHKDTAMEDHKIPSNHTNTDDFIKHPKTCEVNEKMDEKQNNKVHTPEKHNKITDKLKAEEVQLKWRIPQTMKNKWDEMEEHAIEEKKGKQNKENKQAERPNQEASKAHGTEEELVQTEVSLNHKRNKATEIPYQENKTHGTKERTVQAEVPSNQREKLGIHLAEMNNQWRHDEKQERKRPEDIKHITDEKELESTALVKKRSKKSKKKRKKNKVKPTIQQGYENDINFDDMKKFDTDIKILPRNMEEDSCKATKTKHETESVTGYHFTEKTCDKNETIENIPNIEKQDHDFPHSNDTNRRERTSVKANNFHKQKPYTKEQIRTKEKTMRETQRNTRKPSVKTMLCREINIEDMSSCSARTNVTLEKAVRPFCQSKMNTAATKSQNKKSKKKQRKPKSSYQSDAPSESVNNVQASQDLLKNTYRGKERLSTYHKKITKEKDVHEGRDMEYDQSPITSSTYLGMYTPSPPVHNSNTLNESIQHPHDSDPQQYSDNEQNFDSDNSDEDKENQSNTLDSATVNINEMKESINYKFKENAIPTSSNHKMVHQNKEHVLDMSWFRTYQYYAKRGKVQDLYSKFDKVQEQLTKEADRLEHKMKMNMNSRDLLLEAKCFLQLKKTEEETLIKLLEGEEKNRKRCNELWLQLQDFKTERQKLLSDRELLQREISLSRDEKFGHEARKCYQGFEPTTRQACKGQYLSRYEHDLILRLSKADKAIESNIREMNNVETDYNDVYAKKKDFVKNTKAISDKITKIKKHLEKLQELHINATTTTEIIQKLKRLREQVEQLKLHACKFKVIINILQNVPEERRYHIPTLMETLTDGEKKTVSWIVTKQSKHQKWKESQRKEEDVFRRPHHRLMASDPWKVSTTTPKHKPCKHSTQSWTVEPKDAVRRYVVIKTNNRDNMWVVTDNSLQDSSTDY